MSTITLRTLTKKSTLNFGTYSTTTVETLIGMNKKLNLVSIYFKLSKINFNEDVLKELGIEGKWIVNKPGVDKEKYEEFINIFYGKKRSPCKKLQAMSKETKNLSKMQLQTINHSK